MSKDRDHWREGFAADMPHLARRRVLVTGPAMGGAALSLRAARSGAQAVTGRRADGTVCVATPVETAGPFPADGTNVRAGQTVNILTESGVIREDSCSSIGGLSPVAEGVPVSLEIALVDVRRASAPLGGTAVHVRHCDAEGVHSIRAGQDRDDLRAVGISDDQGQVRFATVFPACYPGRWPHIPFEVFSGAEMAVSGKAALLISQFALPEAACRAVYAANPIDAASLRTIDDMSLARDGSFRDASEEELMALVPVPDGDPAAGDRAAGRVGLVV